jgi:hypothetical protein
MNLNLPPPFNNPFRPGAGHMPPYLAGREAEKNEFTRLLGQTTILQNLVLTGLRGVGKTVLLETLRPAAVGASWAWIGTDLSESASLSEENIAIRLLTDLSVFTSNIVVGRRNVQNLGFSAQGSLVDERLGFDPLSSFYAQTPGLVADKLKRVLQLVWSNLEGSSIKGIVFAYDEAQTLADHREKNQYPLSILLDVFQSIQRQNIPFMLVLTGLPTLYPKLVEARTFSERMFHIMILDRLGDAASREAIQEPIKKAGSPGSFNEASIKTIVDVSGGYPYFIQFICRELFDLFIQQKASNMPTTVPVTEIVQKLDSDFFSGRWARATDRQRDLLSVVASLSDAESPDFEFSGQEVSIQSKAKLQKPMSPSHVNQLLSHLSESGLIYKNRHGRYTFAVPLLGRFIRRQPGYQQLLSLNFK